MVNPKEYEEILKSLTNDEPTCRDKRPCFARNGGKCTILRESYADGECPFCKRKKED